MAEYSSIITIKLDKAMPMSGENISLDKLFLTRSKLISFDKNTTIRDVANKSKMTKNAKNIKCFYYDHIFANVKLQKVDSKRISICRGLPETKNLTLNSTMGDAFSKAFGENWSEEALEIIKLNPNKNHGLVLHLREY